MIVLLLVLLFSSSFLIFSPIFVDKCERTLPTRAREPPLNDDKPETFIWMTSVGCRLRGPPCVNVTDSMVSRSQVPALDPYRSSRRPTNKPTAFVGISYNRQTSPSDRWTRKLASQVFPSVETTMIGCTNMWELK